MLLERRKVSSHSTGTVRVSMDLGTDYCYCMQVVFGNAWVNHTRLVFVSSLALMPSGRLRQTTKPFISRYLVDNNAPMRGHHEKDINDSTSMRGYDTTTPSYSCLFRAQPRELRRQRLSRLQDSQSYFLPELVHAVESPGLGRKLPHYILR